MEAGTISDSQSLLTRCPVGASEPLYGSVLSAEEELGHMRSGIKKGGREEGRRGTTSLLGQKAPTNTHLFIIFFLSAANVHALATCLNRGRGIGDPFQLQITPALLPSPTYLCPFLGSELTVAARKMRCEPDPER